MTLLFDCHNYTAIFYFSRTLPRVLALKTVPFVIFRNALKVLQQPVDVWAPLGGSSLEFTLAVCAPLVYPGLLGKGDYAVNRSGLMDV